MTNVSTHGTVITEKPSAGPILLGEPLGIITRTASTTALVAPTLDTSSPVRVSDLVGIEFGTLILVAQVAAINSAGSSSEYIVTLIGTIDTDDCSISRVVAATPHNGASVVRLSETTIKAWLEGRSSLVQSQALAVELELASSPLCPSQMLAFSPERIFGRHCAVVGASGSGKSWSVARLVEESAGHNSKIIVIDPSGEYRTLSRGVRHVHLGASNRSLHESQEVVLPYYELTEADLVSMLRPTNATQLTKLRAAIRSLKLLQFDPRLGVDGNLPKAQRNKVPFELAHTEYKDEISSPENTFNIANLPMQIGLECVDPIRSHTESSYWGAMNTEDHTACVPLIHRLEDLLQSAELATIFQPVLGQSLLTEVESFLSDQSTSVLRISFEFLPTISRVRETIANALARSLLGVARNNRFRTIPLILAVDEAHQILSRDTSPLSDAYPLEAFNVIAREGRKYGLVLCLATQRPGDIPDDVLAQMGTFVVHRLVSDVDRHAVERASGGLSSELSNRLPLFGPGEALLLGVEFQTPLRVVMAKPCSPPLSEGPNFQSSWGLETVQ